MPSPLTPEVAAAQESLFLSRVRAAMDDVDEIRDPRTGRPVCVKRVRPKAYDESETIRRKMATLGADEADLFDRLPRNRCLVWRVRRGFVSRRDRLIVVAAVVNPIRELILGETVLPRATFASVTSLVQERLAGEGPMRLAGVYSPTGWDAGFRFDALRRPGLGLWLFQPGLRGGFATVRNRAERPPPPFDIESRQERIELVIQYIADHRFDLLMKGLAADEASRELDMTSADVRAAFVEASRRDEFLVLHEGDDLMLRRR